MNLPDLPDPYPKEKPLLKFRIYPNSKSVLYFVVYIWKNRTQMYKHRKHRRGFEACCVEQEWFLNGKRIPRIGEINFYDGGLGFDVISHEMTHAAFMWATRMAACKKMDMSFATKTPNWMKYKDKNWIKNPYRTKEGQVEQYEEDFCYAQGEMVKQFYDRIWRNRRQIEKYHTKQRVRRRTS